MGDHLTTPQDEQGLPTADYHKLYYQRNKDRIKARVKAWAKANPEKVRQNKHLHKAKFRDRYRAQSRDYNRANPHRTLNNHLRRQFGITVEDYRDLLKKQNGVCAICQKPERQKNRNGKPQRLSVDHCHETGVVRGLLCGACNHMLGKIGENTDALRRAIDYLNDHNSLHCNSHRQTA